MNDLAVNPDVSRADIDAVAVYAQLDRIGRNPSFAAAPLLVRLLRYLVEHAVTGDVREVKEYALGVELFERGPSFDPKSDTIVRANVRRLRTRLEEYYAGPGCNDPVVIEIPKGHYLATFRAGVPPGPESQVNGVHRPGRRHWIAGAMAAGLALAAGVYLLRGDDGPGHSQPDRIAVFAFAAPNGDAEATRLADGLAEQIVNTMSPHGLLVIPPGEFSTLSTAGRAAHATELQAAYAIDGIITRDADNRWSVSARIDHIKSRTALWSKSYTATDEATLRMQVATQLTDTLRAAYPDPHVRGFGGWFEIAPDDVDSLRMLLEACFRIRTGNPADNRDIFRTLVARYPNSSELHGALGLTLANSLPAVPAEHRAAQLAEADRAARRAIELDPKRGQGYMALVDVMAAQGATGAEVESVLEEALRRNPEHASVNSYYARLLDATGRSAAAEVYVRRAVAGDPLSPHKQLNFVNIMLNIGKPDEARRALKDTLARWSLPSLWWMQVYFAFLEDPGQVALLLDSPNSPANAAESACWHSLASTTLQFEGDDRRVQGATAVDRCVADRVLPAGVEIEVRTAFGDIEGAMATLQRLTAWNEPGVDAALHARAAPLQHDPRFMSVMQRLGLVDMWRSSKRWPDFCALATLPYDCRAETVPL